MVNLVALYRTPANTDAFNSHFTNTHLPRVKKWPGLRKIEVAKVTGTQIGEPKLYMIEELYFDDEESMQKALASADGQAVAPDMMESAWDSVTVFCIIVMMSFTFNTGIGMTAGFVVYPLFKTLAGRINEVKPGLSVLAVLSLLFFLFYPY
jgi:uncharacterized protein (TIGR02118 family)